MKHNEEIHDEIGDNHISSCANLYEKTLLILLMTKKESIKRCRKYPSYTWDGFDR
jgi:hypothetical protein